MSAMPDQQWVFRARAGRVVDGDTLDLDAIDVGFHATRYERVRLLGVDTPERGEAGWAEATAFVRAWLASTPDAAWPLVVRTVKSDAFGRYLADIWRLEDGAHLNDDLIAAGLAVPRDR